MTQDRGHLSTERRNPATANLDALDTAGVLEAIHGVDAAIHGAVGAALPAINGLVDAALPGLAATDATSPGRLIYIGAGTSGRLGVLDASEIPPTFHADPRLVQGYIAGGDSALRISSEGKEDERDGAHAILEPLNLGPNDTLIGLAAGGTTPYVHGGIEFAQARGATTALMCCVRVADMGMPNPAKPDHIIELLVGPEAVTGSTRMKSGTATKLALNLISTTCMVKLGKTWGNLMVDLKASNIKLKDRAERILMHTTQLDRAAAADLLQRADGRVKAGIVMHHRNVELAAADVLLAEHHGQLRAIVGEPPA